MFLREREGEKITGLEYNTTKTISSRLSPSDYFQ